MTVVIALALAAAGTWLIASGGFAVGRWWQRRIDQASDQESQTQVKQLLDGIVEKLVDEDDLAAVLEPIARGGRMALDDVLARLREHGGYAAVVVSDDAGLVIAMCGSSELAELMAVEAAAFGSASERVQQRRQTILHTQPEKRWTLHRYFRVEGSVLSISACRQGGTPKAEALDGSLRAIQTVLGTPAGAAVNH